MVATIVPHAAWAVPQERVLSSGTADSSNAQGSKWRKVSFAAQRTGLATFKLSWTGAGDLRFQILRADNTVIGGSTSTTASPKTYSTNVVAGTSYFATIWAYSGVGAYSFSMTEDFPDTQSPAAPTGLNTTAVGADFIHLTWQPATDNVAVVNYEVSRNGVIAGQTVGTTFQDAGLSESTNYSYQIVAIDAAGNRSQPSAALVALTSSSAPDTEAPTVPQNVRVVSTDSRSVTLQWDAATDNIAVAGYKVARNDVTVTMLPATTLVDTNLAAETQYMYTVRSYDAAGNESSGSAAVAATTAATPTAKPNVVIINTDDQRADTMVDLPKIRRWLADGGTQFTNGYVSTPSCCPSRATLMSGQYVHNNQQFGQQNQGVNLDLTLQRYLKDAGYFTGHSGKFIHWLPLSQVAPYWDRWTYFKGGYENVWMRMDNQTVQSQGYSTTITFDKALNYLDDFESRNDDTPFYMSLAPIAPHSPSIPEPQYANAAVPTLAQTPAHTETDKSDKPSFVRNMNTTYTDGDSNKTAMTRTLYSVDDQVDRLMNRLQELGELDNTLIIYTSDNGYLWGEHGLRSKFLPYTESIKVPFLMRWPNHIGAGITDDRWVTHADIAPTVLSAAGVTQNLVQFDGRDILSGHERSQALTEYYYDTANGNSIPTWAAIQNDSYLYVEYYAKDNNRVTPSYREYYDMVNDPYQLQNLLGDTSTANDPNVTALTAQLAALKDCSGASCQ